MSCYGVKWVKKKIALTVVFAVVAILCIFAFVGVSSLLKTSVSAYKAISEDYIKKIYLEYIISCTLSIIVFLFVIIAETIFTIKMWKNDVVYFSKQVAFNKEEYIQKRKEKKNKKLNEKIEKLKKEMEKSE